MGPTAVATVDAACPRIYGNPTYKSTLGSTADWRFPCSAAGEDGPAHAVGQVLAHHQALGPGVEAPVGPLRHRVVRPAHAEDLGSHGASPAPQLGRHERHLRRAPGPLDQEGQGELHRLRLGVPLVEPGLELGRQAGVEFVAAAGHEVVAQAGVLAVGGQRRLGPLPQLGIDRRVARPRAAGPGQRGQARDLGQHLLPRRLPVGGGVGPVASGEGQPQPAGARAGHEVAEHPAGRVGQVGRAVRVGPEVEDVAHGPVVDREVLGEQGRPAQDLAHGPGPGGVDCGAEDRRARPHDLDASGHGSGVGVEIRRRNGRAVVGRARHPAHAVAHCVDGGGHRLPVGGAQVGPTGGHVVPRDAEHLGAQVSEAGQLGDERLLVARPPVEPGREHEGDLDAEVAAPVQKVGEAGPVVVTVRLPPALAVQGLVLGGVAVAGVAPAADPRQQVEAVLVSERRAVEALHHTEPAGHVRTSWSRAATSAAVGSDGRAPGRVTARAPAARAGRAASRTVRPAARPATRAPQNASPAAVVSTAVTGKADSSWYRPSTKTTAPRAPRVTITAGHCNASASASCSLATTTSTSSSSAAPTSGPGAGDGLSTVVTPAARAICRARSTAARGTSSWHRSTRAPAISSAAASMSTADSEWLASGATTIELAPAASTVIRATPVAVPGVVATARTSTPSPASAATRVRPASSSPTRATSAVGAPSRAAAAAWLAPLPPGTESSVWPSTVSPGPGRRSTRTTASMLTLPTTTTVMPRTPARRRSTCPPRGGRRRGPRGRPGSRRRCARGLRRPPGRP